MMKFKLTSGLVALLWGISLIQAQPLFIKDSLDIFINREMKRWQVPGLAIAIIKDGRVVLAKGYGVKRSGGNEPVNELTLFQIASNTKAFTGTAVALLHQQKKLSLEAKVTTYMPDFRLYEEDYTRQCTVRDLLCHRIGLQTFQGDFLNWGSNLSRKEIIHKLRDTRPVHPFRYKYGYCNAGFITAGELIPVITDTSWDDYIRYKFFEPLGMRHTNVSYKALVKDPNACAPHTLVDEKLVVMPHTNIENMGPAASVNSCVADMANWLLMQLDSGRFNGKQVVPFSVLAETRKSNTIVSDAGSRLFPGKHFVTYGLGWQSYDYAGRRIFEHGGGANGFVTKTEFIPEENLGVIVYTNTDANSLYDALVKQVIEAYFGLPYRNLSEKYYRSFAAAADAEKKELDSLRSVVAAKNKPPFDLGRYAGRYHNPFYGEIEIKLEKGALNLYFSHHPANIGRLAYLSGQTFLCTYTDVTCGIQQIPFKINDGQVTGVTIKVNDFIDYLSYDFEKSK